MRVIDTVASMRLGRRELRGSVGLVPTMGYLHEGHLALVRQARSENDYAVATIFVNPTQFGPHEDFASYPRDMMRDLNVLEKEGVELVFAPSVREMYPEGTDTVVEVGGVTEPLEGIRRPGHFRGVSTVVTKLFHIISPTRAYFGQKDAQQVRVIRKMVADLNFDLEIVTVPTVREADGLAMSSRNVYLSPLERQAAVVLSRALQSAAASYASGERNAAALRRQIDRVISAEPLANVDYVSVADADSLGELDSLDRPALISLAVRIGKTRLIDNTIVGIGS